VIRLAPEVTGATTIFSRSGGSFVKPRAQNPSRFGCMTLV